MRTGVRIPVGTPADGQEVTQDRSWNVAENEIPRGERSASESDAKRERESALERGAGELEPTQSSIGLGAQDAAARSAAAPAALPCLPSEHLNRRTLFRGGKAYRASAQRLILEVQAMARRYGIERMGMMTLGFEDPPPKTIKEASRRFNSLATNAKFSERYVAWLAVIERSPKTGRLHFHLVVVMKGDIRTGFDFEAVKRRDYCSACPMLRDEWSFLRNNVPKYGFGGYVQLLPVRSDVDAFASYLAKYLVKQFGGRRSDKGARLVRYSKNWTKTVHGPFSWVGERKRKLEAERRLAEIGKLFGFDGETGAERIWGRRWKYHLARTLHCKFELYFNVTMYAKDSLEYFDGLPFALADAWKHFDALAESDESKVLPVG